MKKPKQKKPIELMTQLLEKAAAQKRKRLQAGATRQVVTVTGIHLQFDCSPKADGADLADYVLYAINQAVAQQVGNPSIFCPNKMMKVTGRFVVD